MVFCVVFCGGFEFLWSVCTGSHALVCSIFNIISVLCPQTLIFLGVWGSWSSVRPSVPFLHILASCHFLSLLDNFRHIVPNLVNCRVTDT